MEIKIRSVYPQEIGSLFSSKKAIKIKGASFHKLLLEK